MGEMKEIQLPSGKYLLIQVPQVEIRMEGNKLLWGAERFGIFSKQLPPGKWQIIGKANELTEDDWKGVIPQALGGFFGHITGYKRFEKEPKMDAAPHKTATESALSLIVSESMKPETTLILKQEAK